MSTTTAPSSASPASAHANGNNADAASSSSAAAAGTSKVQASDVGWQFVPQYYTFINNSPQRLHCFYNKKSTFIHGVEGEEVKPCYGQQEIHQKILSLNFQDCKVYIHSIDSQSSAAGGIIIQVIGEMSNASGPWRKFTQTFFLAEQPNGYFVMNDIFRYLKEEGEDEDEQEVDEEIIVDTEQPVESAAVTHSDDIPAAITPAEAPVVSSSSAPQETVEVTSEPVPVPAASEEVPEPAAPVEAAPAVKEASPEPTPAPVVPAPAAERVATPSPSQAPAAAAAPAPATAKASATTKQVEAAPAPAPPAPVAAPVQPPKPAGPKTWASLAASKSGAWGNALASKEATSTPATPAPAPAQRAAAAPQPAAAATESAQQAGQQQQQGGQQRGNAGRVSLLEAAQQVQTPVCFVKLGNWQNPEGPDSVDPSSLRNSLSRFGEIVDVQIVKGKACAFVDFKSVESARKAIIASLSTKDGGEGGIRLSDGARITVEARKEKEERGKGSAGGSSAQKRTPAAGQQPQQQQAGEGGDRGGFVQRGAKSGRGSRGKAAGGVGGDRQPAAQK